MSQKGLPAALTSKVATERRNALKRIPALTPTLREELAILRASESDQWVRHGIDRLLRDSAPVTEQGLELEQEVLVDPTTANEIREMARGEIAELLVHEIKHDLFHIESAAEEEIPSYEQSSTRMAIRRLQELAESLRQLADATRSPRMIETSIAELVQASVDSIATSFWPPKVYGPTDVFVVVDPVLLGFAVTNCVRNALDASVDARHTARPVTITWGRTDRDAWVAIHDDGVGLVGDIGLLFQPHHTTKGGAGHSGLGLTISQNALRSMGGEVTLAQREPRGAICELRWPQPQ